MKLEQFRSFLQENMSVLNDLNQRKIYLITDIPIGGLLTSEAKITFNVTNFTEKDLILLKKLIHSSFLKQYPYPVIFDLKKALSFYKANVDLSDEREAIKNSFLLSRINFMGTDGIRGKTNTESRSDYISEFLLNNILTPVLIECCVSSFAQLLLNNKLIHKGDIVCFGEDGRDIITDGVFKQAVINGFRKYGLDVLDLGVIPTGIVPYQILKRNLMAGAVLTASHNPSNQNGIKFFLNGKKLLPEGYIGDYTLSAYIYYNFLNPNELTLQGKVKTHQTILTETKDFVLSVLPQILFDKNNEFIIIFDTSNGATHEISEMVLNELGFMFKVINETPDGYNINKDCGVAELEGHDVFKADNYDKYPKLIRELFDVGRKDKNKRVIGISLDGDGDRGYLSLYDSKDDNVYIINGDKCGYLLSNYLIKEKSLNPNEHFFVTTIESDLMTSVEIEKKLGLQVKIVSVGDKWIGSFTEGKLLVGVEVSGHLIFPIEFLNDVNKSVTLFTGIGILTGLMTLSAIIKSDLSNQHVFQPFKQGISKSFYTYFIDKTKFYKNSSVWLKDLTDIKNFLTTKKQNSELDSNLKLKLIEKENPNVLYFSIMNEDETLGAVFIRNSGTEDKIVTYIQGTKELEIILLELGSILVNNHTNLLKNKDKIEYTYERSILKNLEEISSITFLKLHEIIEKEISEPIDKNNLYSVLHGLKKENRINFEAETISKKKM